jgi:hypothetical protein
VGQDIGRLVDLAVGKRADPLLLWRQSEVVHVRFHDAAPIRVCPSVLGEDVRYGAFPPAKVEVGPRIWQQSQLICSDQGCLADLERGLGSKIRH